ncbi:hypothetical protein LCGC14_2577500 [marine sediment metagenome]|uniref:NadR/Ttd14 AAA domain-containing protein n=1 Tax=marine sediment metagenome TaxID=412755 RepID=A0A0F9D849_9ZZZZ
MSHYQGDDCPKRHCPDIGLVGWMRSGKDSVADWLIEHYGYRKLGFATALKAEVARGVGCRSEELNAEPLKSQVRQVLQVWGTEFRRGQDPDYWVKMARGQILLRGADRHPHPLVFTDVRFQNEIDMLRDHGFLIVHVDMPLRDVTSYFLAHGKTDEQIEAMLSHPSEQEWQHAEVNERIESNRGDLLGLYAQTKLLVERHADRISTTA